MEQSLIRKQALQKKRALRVRKNIRGTADRPRLSVNKTNVHMYAQIIDDELGKTIVGVGTFGKKRNMRKSKDSAKKIGAELAKLAKEKGIEKVVFDRGRFKYHGLIAELANAARESGLKF